MIRVMRGGLFRSSCYTAPTSLSRCIKIRPSIIPDRMRPCQDSRPIELEPHLRQVDFDIKLLRDLRVLTAYASSAREMPPLASIAFSSKRWLNKLSEIAAATCTQARFPRPPRLLSIHKKPSVEYSVLSDS